MSEHTKKRTSSKSKFHAKKTRIHGKQHESLRSYWEDLKENHAPQREFVDWTKMHLESWPEANRKWPGSSRYQRYSSEDAPFCGPAGGSAFNSFPVTNPARARAALSYSRHAPNEKGIRDCVSQVVKERGWQKRLAQSMYRSHYPKLKTPFVPRGKMKSTARTHTRAKYPGYGGKRSTRKTSSSQRKSSHHLTPEPVVKQEPIDLSDFPSVKIERRRR